MSVLCIKVLDEHSHIKVKR